MSALPSAEHLTGLRRVVLAGALAGGVLISLPTLTLAHVLVRYDQLSYRGHAAHLRRILPRRPFALLGPLVALYALAAGYLIERPASTSTVGFVVVGLVLAEVYSVCLHREAWIAAFEPEWIASGATPLGGPPAATDDRRLHHLARTLTSHCLVLAIVGLAIDIRADPVAALIASLFMAKCFAHGASDYEVFFHWHMHCDVMRIRGRPRLTRVWEFIADWGLGPLNGYVPHVYRANHLLIHHPENSGPGDIHSPLPYNRASYLEFSAFALRMCGSLLLATDLAFHRRCRRQHRRAVLAGVAIYWLGVSILLAHGRLLGLWLVILVFHRGVSAARSQWVWHGLIDPAQPDSPVRTTIMWVPNASWWEDLVAAGRTRSGAEPATKWHEEAHVPAAGTDWAFYDNHHLLHHLFPRTHYRRFPQLLARHAVNLHKARASVVDLAGLERFAFNCWSNNIDELSKVVLTGTKGPDRTALITQRLKPSHEHRASIAPLCTSHLGRKLDRRLVRLIEAVTGGR